MRRRTLRAAVGRLEAKRRHRKLPMPVILGLYAGEGSGEIIALSGNGGTVDRLASDTDLNAFSRRASIALGGARILLARYVAPVAPMPVPAPFAAPTPTPVAAIEQHGEVLAGDFFRTGRMGWRG